MLGGISLRAVGGTWTTAAATEPVVDPLNGEVFLNVADTKVRCVRAGSAGRACPTGRRPTVGR